MPVINAATIGSDIYYTPTWISKILCERIKGKYKTCWEPAAGEGHLTNVLKTIFEEVHETEIEKVQCFLNYIPSFDFDCIITNPPFSLKTEFINKCIQHKKPFALLLPLTALEGQTRAKLWKSLDDFSVLLPDRRVHFINGDRNVNFVSAWFCSGFNLGERLIFVESKKTNQMSLF